MNPAIVLRRRGRMDDRNQRRGRVLPGLLAAVTALALLQLSLPGSVGAAVGTTFTVDTTEGAWGGICGDASDCSLADAIWAANANPGKDTIASTNLPDHVQSNESAPVMSTPPNILLILTDDQRPDGALSVMPETRRLFIRGGAKFVNAFATTPRCCPSRASIFTGPVRPQPRSENQCTRNEPGPSGTIQRYLHDAGYGAAYFGKFFNAWPHDVSPAYFDEWAIHVSGRRRYYDASFNINGRVRTLKGYVTNILLRRAKRFIRQQEKIDSQPWILMLGLTAPHAPYDPDKRHRGAEVPRWRVNPAVKEKDLTDKPPYVGLTAGRFTIDRVRRIRRAQLRTLMSVDHLVDKTFQTLRRLHENRDTLAIYVSDNGYSWGEHGLRGPRYGKRTPYDKSAGIPLYVRWPDHVARGTLDKRLVANIDLAPTILEAARMPSSQLIAPMDGRSLFSGYRRTSLFLEHWEDDLSVIPPWNALRTESYLYVENYRPGGSADFVEYYDLGLDPWQLTNLLNDDDSTNDPSPALLESLSSQIGAAASCVGGDCP